VKNLNKTKVLGLFIIILCLICVTAQPISAAKTYNDYYWKGSYLSADDNGISYHYLKNGAAVTRWTRDIPAATVSIDHKLVYVLDKHNVLIALNKTNGKDIWTLDLFESYSKSQFVTRNYLLLSSPENAAMIKLTPTHLVWTKSYNMANLVFFGAIKAKNGSYYLMLKSASKTRFYKLQV